MKKEKCSSPSQLMSGAIVCLLLCSQAVKADFIFGEPEMVPNINSDSDDGSPQISRNGLELYFSSKRDSTHDNIWVSKRLTTEDPWSSPAKLDSPVNSSGSHAFPSLSSDGLELYYTDGHNNPTPDPNGHGQADIWLSTRADLNSPWDVPSNLGPVINTGVYEGNVSISANGLELFHMSNESGYARRAEILVTTRATQDDPWGVPVALGTNVNGDLYESTPFISPDGLSLFFARGIYKSNIYVSRRATLQDPWGPAQSFDPVNSGGPGDVWGYSPGSAEYSISFSTEDPTIYFQRGTDAFSTDYDIWQVKVTPVVDFNGDGAVDLLDAYDLLDHWGSTEDSLYDIAPFPLGDGAVDAKDLMVLSGYMPVY